MRFNSRATRNVSSSEFTAKGTPPNRLFLAECGQRNVTENVQGAKGIKDALAWFDSGLVAIFPEFDFGPLVVQTRQASQIQGPFRRGSLKCWDTGIANVRLESRDSESFPMTSGDRKRIESGLKSREISSVTGPDQVEWVPVRAEDGTIRMSRIVLSRDARSKANGRRSLS